MQRRHPPTNEPMTIDKFKFNGGDGYSEDSATVLIFYLHIFSTEENV